MTAIVGASGASWSYDDVQDRLEQPYATGGFWRGRAGDGRPALVKMLMRASAFDEARTNAWREIDRGREPRIRAISGIRQLLDYLDGENLYLMLEWADESLDAAAERVAADIVLTQLAATLAALHAAGFVHCDVAANNILRQGERWLLADLGHCQPIGGPISGFSRKCHAPEAVFGAPAQPAMDWFGLGATLFPLATDERTRALLEGLQAPDPRDREAALRSCASAPARND